MKKLLMLAMLLLLAIPSNAKDKVKATSDGHSGVEWKYYHDGQLCDTQHFNAQQWAILQRHWNTGEPLLTVHCTEPAELAEKQKIQEDRFLSDEMYNSLWRQLYDWEARNYYVAGPTGSRRRRKDTYGYTWLTLTPASRSEWYKYLFPKIDFNAIAAWSDRAHAAASEAEAASRYVEERNRKEREENERRAYDRAQHDIQYGGSGN